MDRAYLCIDLKCFYASVECVDRGEDPFAHRLVVADPTRGPKTICLAISPAMKALGVRNRCRVFEIPDGIEYETARPRMRRYMEVSAGIYARYLRYFSPEDIHVYSVDEVFIDVTPYLALYGKTPRELATELIEMVRDAMVRNYVYLERDILGRSLGILDVRGYEYKGYRSRIYSMKSYFDENMRLLERENREALFPEARPVYTKVRDEAPVRYAMDAKVSNCLVTDGCIIEGTIENCVLFRGVRVEKGAVVKNCVLMQGTTVATNAKLEYIVTDKDVTITANKTLLGNESFPVYVEKGTEV